MKKLMLCMSLVYCLEGSAGAAPEAIDVVVNEMFQGMTPLDREGEAKFKRAGEWAEQYQPAVVAACSPTLYYAALWGARMGAVAGLIWYGPGLGSTPLLGTVGAFCQYGLTTFRTYFDDVLSHTHKRAKMVLLQEALDANAVMLNAGDDEQGTLLRWALEEGGKRRLVDIRRRLYGNGNDDLEANPPA